MSYFFIVRTLYESKIEIWVMRIYESTSNTRMLRLWGLFISFWSISFLYWQRTRSLLHFDLYIMFCLDDLPNCIHDSWLNLFKPHIVIMLRCIMQTLLRTNLFLIVCNFSWINSYKNCIISHKWSELSYISYVDLQQL